jgi:hypothetical protein
MLPTHLMHLEILWGQKMGEHFCCRIEGIFGNSYVYGNSTATKYPNILGKRGLSISLFYNLKYYVSLPIHTIAKMSPYYKSRNL